MIGKLRSDIWRQISNMNQATFKELLISIPQAEHIRRSALKPSLGGTYRPANVKSVSATWA